MAQMISRKFKNQTLLHLGLIFLLSLILGAVFQILTAVGAFLSGFIAATLLILVSGGVLYLVWRVSGGGKALAWMMVLAFLLRFALGIFIAWGMPLFGYDEEPQRAGFVFEDAFRREGSAWFLARSDDPLTRAFGDEYETDQYGGMLAMSAFVYRYISPDAYRPALISILSAAAMALSIPFLVAALRGRFDRKTILWAGWILALYPEGILLGAAQLREPYIILLLTVLFWSVNRILDRRRLKLVIPILVLGVLSLFLLTFRVALPILGVLLLWVWVHISSGLSKKWIKYAGWAVIFLGVLGVLWVLRYWVDAVLHWDTLVTIRRSGRLQFHLESLPQWLHFPFILGYGVFQPVLPAAIAAPAPWIWRGLGIFRALGWYALAPLLVYALVSVWRLEPSVKKRWLVVMVLVISAWVLVASARAGGDQWDNPRYRTIFLPWMAAVSAWGITHAKQTRDRWLCRALLIEGIFLLFFTYWYIGRYYLGGLRLELFAIFGMVVGLSIGVIVWGWLRDRRRTREDAPDPQDGPPVGDQHDYS